MFNRLPKANEVSTLTTVLIVIPNRNRRGGYLAQTPNSKPLLNRAARNGSGHDDLPVNKHIEQTHEAHCCGLNFVQGCIILVDCEVGHLNHAERGHLYVIDLVAPRCR